MYKAAYNDLPLCLRACIELDFNPKPSKPQILGEGYLPHTDPARSLGAIPEGNRGLLDPKQRRRNEYILFMDPFGTGTRRTYMHYTCHSTSIGPTWPQSIIPKMIPKWSKVTPE